MHYFRIVLYLFLEVSITFDLFGFFGFSVCGLSGVWVGDARFIYFEFIQITFVLLTGFLGFVGRCCVSFVASLCS